MRRNPQLVRLCTGAALLVLILLAFRARLIVPAPTLLLRDRHGGFLGEVSATNEGEAGYWPVDTLPPRVVAATLLTEDRRFWRHPGVDPLAVARSAWHNLRGGHRLLGASTIAMQVARMQHPGRRTYVRKALEAVTACWLTARYGRAAVLRQYLRIVPYGHRIHGIAYAARRYLNKPVDDLSWAEIAFLAAIPQAPSHMDPYTQRGRERAVYRGRRILEALWERHALPSEEYEMAVQQIAALQIPPLPARPLNAIHVVLRFQHILRDPAMRGTLPASGLVDTTIDRGIQDAVAGLAADTMHELESRGLGNVAVMVLDRDTNQVLAALGSAGYFDVAHAGAYDYTRVPRSPGSTLKPFLYGLALDRGIITPATILDDVERPAADVINADEAFLGPLLPRVALANSRNVPAAGILAVVGLDEGYAFLRALRLHDNDESAHHYGLGLSIGAMPVTLERLVHAYTMLAGDGRLADLIWYDGQPVGLPRRLLSEETVRQVTLFLADPMARLPTFPRMGPSEYPFPVAVKTGTSSRYRDALTVAYSTRFIVGVWLGRPDHRPMSRVTAVSSAARLAQKILTLLHRDQTGGLDDLQFPPPHGYRPERICALTGKRATAACGAVFLEWFRPGQEPVADCDAHVQLAVDTRDGLLASSFTPRQFVEVRTFTTLPARYAAWAEAAGLPRPPTEVSPLDGTRVAVAPEQRRPAVVRRSSTLRLLAPESGARVVRDPESPPASATLALRVVVDPPADQVVWYVDNAPFEVVSYPYTARWALKPGHHTFQARLPFTNIGSGVARVTVE